jgi:hypothetical protein
MVALETEAIITFCSCFLYLWSRAKQGDHHVLLLFLLILSSQNLWGGYHVEPQGLRTQQFKGMIVMTGKK